jgi:hypothetical protein
MLDFSDEAFVAQLIPPGTYSSRLIDVKLVGSGPVFLAFTWQVEVPGRPDPASIEELARVDIGPRDDPGQAACGRARIRAIIDAHGIEPTFSGYDQLIRAIIGKEMQVVVRHGRKAGLPVAKLVGLLPSTTADT